MKRDALAQSPTSTGSDGVGARFIAIIKITIINTIVVTIVIGSIVFIGLHSDNDPSGIPWHPRGCVCYSSHRNIPTGDLLELATQAAPTKGTRPRCVDIVLDP